MSLESVTNPNKNLGLTLKNLEKGLDGLKNQLKTKLEKEGVEKQELDLQKDIVNISSIQLFLERIKDDYSIGKTIENVDLKEGEVNVKLNRSISIEVLSEMKFNNAFDITEFLLTIEKETPFSIEIGNGLVIEGVEEIEDGYNISFAKYDKDGNKVNLGEKMVDKILELTNPIFDEEAEDSFEKSYEGEKIVDKYLGDDSLGKVVYELLKNKDQLV